ncbi:hypothetical protein [Deinococcus sp. Leaf326]|uniref:hypothetical protein n=1 Tax=Deinococcus sp. Leaf326 TaxID=1736338 RepID=UPI0006F850A4|nr:hypothetical protein [Deinococcus sp. Leaf326]KQR40774.1 hypothetical protein ASF71_00985 [Deinococcus sp. Leaf326]
MTPCPHCHQTQHALTCPRHPVARARAAAAASCLGGVTAPEDHLTLDRMVIPYDAETGRVVQGRYLGLQAHHARAMAGQDLSRAYRIVEVQITRFRPWWRLWRSTAAVVLLPSLPR